MEEKLVLLNPIESDSMKYCYAIQRKLTNFTCVKEKQYMVLRRAPRTLAQVQARLYQK